MQTANHDALCSPSSDHEVETLLRGAIKAMVWSVGAGCVVTDIIGHRRDPSVFIFFQFRCIGRVLFMLLLDTCGKTCLKKINAMPAFFILC